MAKAKTSKPDSSTTKLTGSAPFDKLYWFRIGLGVLAGLLANQIFSPSGAPSAVIDYFDGILFAMIIYFASFYVARYGWYRKIDKTDLTKLYTTGIGGFVMVFLFTWILLFTVVLGVA